MKGVNKVILVATLGNDPEIRYTQNGGAVANFTAATNEKWTDKQTGEQHENTEWHRLSAFGRTAEIIGEYLSKGSQVYVEGKLQTRKWQDSNGVDRYTTEILVRELQMLGGGNNGNQGGQGGHNQGGNRGNQGGRAPQNGGRAPQNGGRAPQNGGRAPQNGGRAAPQNNGMAAPQGGGYVPAEPAYGNGFDDFDDDIPF